MLINFYNLTFAFGISLFILLIYSQMRHTKLLTKELKQVKDTLFNTIIQQQSTFNESITLLLQKTGSAQQEHLVHLQSTLRDHFFKLDQQIQESLHRNTQHLSLQFDKLNHATQAQLLKISESVEIRLAKGFEKTNETFTNIIQRLALIDDAQKKITDLSKNIVSLQEILSDKHARGAFGEVQLQTLVKNMLPKAHYFFQYTLSNGMRADCFLSLPEPTGNIVIDAKFPLENYKKSIDKEISESLKAAAKQQFKIDVKKHIQDISEKYIIEGETNNGALMFIPAEAIFAEIHAHHPDLVTLSQQKRVWITSPSTMMAILTTACAVLKDFNTRTQIHIIQEHLRILAQDFLRFEKRMDMLSRHIEQAHSDVALVHTSAQKISKRFHQIESVEVLAEKQS